MISVVIPVGPFPANKKWLNEAIGSVADQLGYGDEILIVDDYAKLRDHNQYRVVRNPWRLGVAASFNIGVMSAGNDLSIMLGSDDKLLPGAIKACKDVWEATRNPLAYYYMKVVYNNGELQDLPCNAAMVHKALWKHNGGFPPETAVGAPDSCLISIMLAASGAAGNLIKIPSDGPLYWVRRHDGQDNMARGSYQGVIYDVRHILTRDWVKPTWTR